MAAKKYTIQSDGRYRTRVWDGTYKNGRKHFVYLSSTKSSKDLERIVSEYVAKRDEGMITVSKNISIQDYAKQWLKAEKGLSQSATREMYEVIVNVHLKPFRAVPFEYFNAQNVISKSAERDRLIPSGKTFEIFDRVQIPKYKPKERQPLTDEQCKIVHNAISSGALPPRSNLFLLLIYFCGLRREEALAVKYDDLIGLSISVNKALHLGATKTEVKDTKTERGNRIVPLPAEAVRLLEKMLPEMLPNKDGYMFYTKTGELITKSSYTKMWEGIVKELGFDCTAHIFRHTYCTKLCYEAYNNRTISVKQIARLLGDTEKMVTDVYSHIVEEKEQTNAAIKSIFENDSRQHVGNI